MNRDDCSMLQHCYEQLKKVIDGPLEPFEIVCEVQKYREYWKPENVNIVLLAESHVYTSEEDFSRKLDLSKLDLQGYPDRYVRFVYCFGYGESAVVKGLLEKNTGTPQFWKLFYSCCHPFNSPHAFDPILKTKAGMSSVTNKINLLMKMKQLGVWLLDASIIGINDKNKPSPEKYDGLIRLCWKEYISHIIRKTNPSHVVCIGKKVGGILQKYVKDLTGNDPTVLSQPGAFLTKQGLKNLHESLYSICSRYCTGSSVPQPDMSLQGLNAKGADLKTINNNVKGTKKSSIKSMAKAWMTCKYGKLQEPNHASKYYPAKEAFTGKPAWWVQFSKDEIWPGKYEFVNWLLQKKPGSNDFYHLKVPTAYLREHELELGRIKEKFSLFLSAEKDVFFQDENGTGQVNFAQFLEELKMNDITQDRILGGLWGAIIGDALGVPVEFMGREQVRRNPITGMRGYGTFNLPPGSWSDDSSLLLSSVESLLDGFDTEKMGKLFIRWLNEGYWTPWGETFDVGNSTMSSIRRLMKGVPTEEAGGRGENDNGNGSLMRIIPVGIFFANQPVEELLNAVHRASSITHRHPRTLMACEFYCLMVRSLLEGCSADRAYKYAIDQARVNYTKMPFAEELNHFERLFSGLMGSVPGTAIQSGGYVLHTLEASIWCLLNSKSFDEAVLKAVNLGEDTDTTGCVTGGLAGVYYGLKEIPKEWLNTIARKEDIGKILSQFTIKVME